MIARRATRRGPLRRVVARVGAGWHAEERLECGHRWVPSFVRASPHHLPERSDRRRCVFCPDNPRAEYFRAKAIERTVRRGQSHAA